MSRRWTAKCWLGSKSGYVDIEVNANTLGGAKEQLQNIYGAEQIINLREIRKSNDGGGFEMSSDGKVLLVGLLGAGALLLYFTPWVLMTVYGAGATWITQKIVGIKVSDFEDYDNPSEEDTKKGIAILVAAIVFGGVGFVHGTIWNQDLNREYNLDGKQSQVQQVRQK